MAMSIGLVRLVRRRTTPFCLLHSQSDRHQCRFLASVFLQRRTLSQKPNNPPDVQKTDNEEDFFGIPYNFKLQHARQNTSENEPKSEEDGDKTHIDLSQNTPALTELLDPLTSNVIEDSFQSLQEKGKARVKKTVFGTRFGTISFDKHSKISEDELALKAQEIISATKTYSNKSHPVRDRHKRITPTYQVQKSKAEDHLNIKDNEDNPGICQEISSSNFFDEHFFSELSSAAVGPGQEVLDIQNRMLVGKEPMPSPSQPLREDPSKQLLAEKKSNNSLLLSETNQSLRKDNEVFSQSAQNVLDEQYFGDLQRLGSKYQTPPKSKQGDTVTIPDSSLIDEQYFENFQPKNVNLSKAALLDRDWNEIDQQYFEETSRTQLTEGNQHDPTAASDIEKLVKQYTLDGNISQGAIGETSTLALQYYNRGLVSPELEEEQSEEDNPLLDHGSSEEKLQGLPTVDKPMMAYELAMKIRHSLKFAAGKEGQKGAISTTKQSSTISEKDVDIPIGRKVDSKGFRTTEDQLLDLERMTRADILRMLKNKIIFHHEDFLAIDKPYGLPSIGQKHDRVSVSELLPSLATILPKSFQVDNLHLVQGLDRHVTGAILLAKNPEVAAVLQGMYNNKDEVIQRFWVLTKGIPHPQAGVIDIPIGQAKVGNIYKMVLRPLLYKEEKLLGKASKCPSKRALTEYKILTSHLQSALVECTLLTNNVRHQIRLHLASGLTTPILGDHKYSNFSKLAPQKLHKEMLELLKIRQAKVRNLPLHLHCRCVVLTNYKGRTIFLTTRPPPHFKENMKSLKLFAPK